MRRLRFIGLILSLTVLFSVFVLAEDGALMMRFPDIYKDKIVFSYAGDLWLVGSEGGFARRLTSSEGVEYFPKFSPDGKWIAFTGQYKGYFQVFVIPAEGGEVKQLTFYPSEDLPDRMGYDNAVISWTPDGKYIIYRALKGHWDAFVGRLYKVPLAGGLPEPMPFTEGGSMSYSPDGKKLALNRVMRDFRQWKRYTGGLAQDIYIYDFATEELKKITDWKGTDHHPMWYGDKIYFVSDRTGTSNLYSYEVATGKTNQITDYKDWDIKWPGFGPDAIVFELGGRLMKMNFTDGKISEVKVNIAFDNAQLRPSYVDAAARIEEFDIAPGGKRAVFVARGDIFTVPEKKGDVRNLTATPGIRERLASWSPDGNLIAYVSDETGEDELYIADQYGNKKTQLTKGSKSIVQNPVWSPDSTKIAYRDLGQNIYYIDLKTKKVTIVDHLERGLATANWSPDSKWLTYQILESNNFTSIFLYSLDNKKVYRVTERNTADFAPSFDPEGKYLYFISIRDFQPTLGFDFELSYTYNNMSRIYMVMLAADTPNPFEPESDEVDLKKDEEKEKDKDKKDKKKDEKKIVKVKVDIDGIGNRIVALPVQPSNIPGYFPVKEAVYYAKTEDQGLNLYVYDFKEKKEKLVIPGITNAVIDAKGKKILWNIGNRYGIAELKPDKIETNDVLNTRNWMALKDPRAEWKQMIKEAWRLNRDLYYVENMHGVDWPAILNKYLPLVDHLTHRRDLTYIIGEMIGELSTSHTYTGGGEMPEVPNVKTGLLGAEFDLDENGFYKISKIYHGENWTQGAKSPLTEPGIKASAGNYIISIDGKTLKSPVTPYELLENTLGKTVTIKLNSKPVEEGAWEIKVDPTNSETQLRYLDWVEQKAKYVREKTNDRIGYVHIPDMGFNGLNQFVKTYYSQIKKEGIIIDDRYNGGGFVSQMILERLRRIIIGLTQSRLSGIDTYPVAAFSGHLVALCNMYSASDGDIFPFYFKEYKLGPVIGTRTWGGVVGYQQINPFIDGGYVIVPTSGSYNLKSEWIMENVGTEPDIVIDTSPVDEAHGRDPQLDRAIEIIMKMVQEKPVKVAPQPPDPVKLK